jgi:hypothetical protein
MGDYSQKSPNVSFRIINLICHVFYPMGKPRIPHLLCCQGFAACDYSFTLDASDLHHPRLLQR